MINQNTNAQSHQTTKDSSIPQYDPTLEFINSALQRNNEHVMSAVAENNAKMLSAFREDIRQTIASLQQEKSTTFPTTISAVARLAPTRRCYHVQRVVMHTTNRYHGYSL
jgi:outer membrane lipopolysaccharide assembly protein LptE/RlpB